MFELLSALEESVLGAAIRGANIWTYGIINLVHILGVSTLFGSILVLDLRLLGAWRSVPLHIIARLIVPVAATGFLVAGASGISMLSVNATEYQGNPFLFDIKLPAIGIGLLNVLVLRLLPAWKALGDREPTGKERRQLAASGGVSLLSWLTAVAAGRMIGYW